MLSICTSKLRNKFFNKNKFVIKGVCCGSNGSSCCPYKYICDEDHLSCQLNGTILIENEIYNYCGSSDVVCRSDQTCCKISQSNDDQYACCAFPDVSY
jgi:hypothetical protein